MEYWIFSFELSACIYYWIYIYIFDMWWQFKRRWLYSMIIIIVWYLLVVNIFYLPSNVLSFFIQNKKIISPLFLFFFKILFSFLFQKLIRFLRLYRNLCCFCMNSEQFKIYCRANLCRRCARAPGGSWLTCVWTHQWIKGILNMQHYHPGLSFKATILLFIMLCHHKYRFWPMLRLQRKMALRALSLQNR